MNIRDLETKLIECNVPQDVYSILKGGLPNEKYCIAKNNDGWEVYYSERGQKTGLTVFDEEDAACKYFLKMVLKYGIQR